MGQKKGYKCSLEHKQNIRRARLGTKIPEETKRKISKTLQGHHYNRGRVMSAEWKLNLSEATKRYMRTHPDKRFFLRDWCKENRFTINNRYIIRVRDAQDLAYYFKYGCA